MTEAAVKTVQRPRRGRRGLSEAELRHEAEWRLWFPNVQWGNAVLDDATTDRLLRGFESFCLQIEIKHPSRGRIPLQLRDAQRETVRAWIQHTRVVNLKARQIGFSTLAAAFMLWIAMGWADKHIIALSRGERESIKLLGKAKLAYRSLDEWIRKRGPVLLDKAKQTMTFDNESVVESLPSASDPARGESVFLIIVDEWAFLNDPDQAWASIEPVADIGGRIIGISTANGEGNFFHRLWVGATAERNGFVPVFWSWDAVDERDEVWYSRKAEELPLWQLHQEYPRSPEEAFVGSGNPVFNLDVLGEMEVSEPLMSVGIESSRPKDWTMFEDGDLHVWVEPEEGEMYAVGADTAQGLEHGDFTVCTVLRVSDGAIVAIFRARVDPDVLGEFILPGIGFYYNYALIAPEVNNHGLTTLKGLQRAGYGRLYRRRAMAKRVDSPTETMGWYTTRSSKPLLVDELAAWLREHNVPYGPLLAELKTFTRDKNGNMSGSPHDDCVMSLGVAVQALKYCYANPHIPDDVVVPGSIDWWDRKLSAANGSENRRLSPSMSRSRKPERQFASVGRSYSFR
jgi:hypothetical protein